MQVLQPALETGAAFQLSPGLQSKLELLGSEMKTSSGEILFHQGTDCRGVYVVRSGAARIFMVDDKGRMVTCRDVGPGCILGLPATLCVQPYMFTAETKLDCTLKFISAEEFQEFLRVNPALCMEVLQLMSSELTAVNRRRTELSQCTQSACNLRGTCASTGSC